MKKIKLLAIPLFAAFITPVVSQNLYVYDAQKKDPILMLDNVRKIIFNSSEVGVQQKDGSMSFVLFSDFSFFSFEPKQIVLTSMDIIEQNKIAVCYNRDIETLNVRSETKISSVELISISGQAMKRYIPLSKNFNFSVACCPDGVYLVKIVSEKKEIVQKIIKK